LLKVFGNRLGLRSWGYRCGLFDSEFDVPVRYSLLLRASTSRWELGEASEASSGLAELEEVLQLATLFGVI
jgi:hypothetical protein